MTEEPRILEFRIPGIGLIDWTSKSPRTLGAKKATLDLLLTIEGGLNLFSSRERQRLLSEWEETVTQMEKYTGLELGQFRDAYDSMKAALRSRNPNYDVFKYEDLLKQ